MEHAESALLASGKDRSQGVTAATGAGPAERGSVMRKVAVVTDSAACLPSELIREYDISVVPFGLAWGHRVYRDGVDMTADEFYRRLRDSEELPTTSQPTAEDLVSAYQALVGKYEGVVSIHIPASLSSTLRVAKMAAEMVPDIPVRVVDCGMAVMAEGFVVLAAARAAAEGADLDEVVRAAEAMMPRVRLYASLRTLKYLARSGRVPAVAATVGSALHIHPILSMQNGRISMIARARSKERAREHILERMAADVADSPVHAAVFHAGILEEAQALQREIAAQFDCAELYVTEFTPVMGAHTGPGVLGVAFYAEDEAS